MRPHNTDIPLPWPVQTNNVQNQPQYLPQQMTETWFPEIRAVLRNLQVSDGWIATGIGGNELG